MIMHDTVIVVATIKMCYKRRIVTQKIVLSPSIIFRHSHKVITIVGTLHVKEALKQNGRLLLIWMVKGRHCSGLAWSLP